MTKSLLAITTALLASACTVGPDYTPPAALSSPAPLGLVEQAPRSNATEVVRAESKWWEAFGDPMLTDLIDHAVAENHNLRIASANVRLARALRRSESSTLLPQLGAGASYARQRGSENGQTNLGALSEAGVADVETDLMQVGFDARWEIDLFGGNQRRVEAASAKVESAIESRRDVLLSIISEVARNYGELRGNQLQIDITNRRIVILVHTLEIAQAKLETGIGTQLDVERARTNLASTRAQLPRLHTAERSAAYRLAVLTGRQPAVIASDLLISKPLPISLDIVPVGLQSDLLSRRPDVRRAERELAAASAEIGVAKAEFFPKFSLTGAAGQESTSFSNLLSGTSSVFSIIPSITFPLFNGGRLRAQLEAANAGNDMAIAQFEQAILLAVEDVEASLVLYVETNKQTEALQEALSAGRKSEDLARDLYNSGLGAFIDVLDAERSVTDLELQLAASETESFISTIALYKALGGGWQTVEQRDRTGVITGS
ncbi:efflux transporter outer membrane subunit [Sphingorhabdus sp. Alg231-15]|uniref:efflux transporter outer membrane subunit n=1 Tax=Sphingorhabdus sp. Alg231-15 TaxID=1922222 RepID=UPI000D55E9A4